MPEGVDERTFGEFDEEDWSFGEQQFASGELLRKISELERLLDEEKSRSEGITAREEKKWKEQVDDWKQKANDAKDTYQKLEEDRRDYFKRLNSDLVCARDALDESDSRYYEVMDELLERDDSDEFNRALFEEHEKKVRGMYTSLLAQARVAEERWLMALVVFQWINDLMSGDHGRQAALDIHVLSIEAKALLIRCKDSFLRIPALPIWHESLGKQLKDRSAQDILGLYFKAEQALLPLKDEDGAA